MSERTVYERIVQVPREGYAHYEYAPLDPNPLDEVERLKADLSDLRLASEGYFNEAEYQIAQNARLWGLLRQVHWIFHEHIVQPSQHIVGVRDAIDAAIDGECKHDGGMMTTVETEPLEQSWDGGRNTELVYRLAEPLYGHDENRYYPWVEPGDVFCRLCGAPASEVKP